MFKIMMCVCLCRSLLTVFYNPLVSTYCLLSWSSIRPWSVISFYSTLSRYSNRMTYVASYVTLSSFLSCWGGGADHDVIVRRGNKKWHSSCTNAIFFIGLDQSCLIIQLNTIQKFVVHTMSVSWQNLFRCRSIRFVDSDCSQ